MPLPSAAMILFISRVGQKPLPKILILSAQVALIFSLVSAGLILTESLQMNFFILPAEILSLVNFTLISLIMAVRGIKGDREAFLFVFGSGSLTLLAVHDVLAELGILFSWSGLHAHWGLIGIAGTLIYMAVEHFNQDRIHLNEKTRIDTELGIAQDIQKTLNACTETIPAMDIAHYYQPANQTGGDWFGYYYDEKHDNVFMLCADATGHGIPAALVTGVFTGCVESILLRVKESPEIYQADEVIRELFFASNQSISKIHVKPRMAMTLLCMCLNLRTGRLSYASSGHPPPILKRGDQITYLICPGLPLGILENEVHIDVKHHQLKVNDTLIMYTDGLIENQGPDGRVLKQNNLKAAIRSSDYRSQDVITRILEIGTMVWNTQIPEDDVATIVFTLKTLITESRSSKKAALNNHRLA